MGLGDKETGSLVVQCYFSNNSLEGLLELKLPGPTLRVSDSVYLGWSQGGKDDIY